MTWYSLFNRIGKQTINVLKHTKVYALLDNPATGKTEKVMLTIKYDAKGQPYLIKE